MTLDLGADRWLRRRQRAERIARSLLALAALSSLVTLVVLVWRIAERGGEVLKGTFWTRYSPLDLLFKGSTGILDALYASVIVLVMTLVIAVPVGVAAGVYLQEYAARNRLSLFLRTTVANLAGVPSVVYGLLGLAVFVRLMGLGTTMLAGSLTLAALILPMIIVSTEEALKTVPGSVREASLALGATKWQTIRSHVLPYAMPGILTGNILALSRAAGETAPLIVIGIPAFTTVFGTSPLDHGTPLQVRTYFLSQEAKVSLQELAGGAIVLLLLMTLLLNLAAIVVRQRLSKRIRW